MNVLYTCDNNYIWIMGISVVSLFENNKHIGKLTVYLLGENISHSNKSMLKEIGDRYKRNIIVIDVPELDIPDIMVSSRWPLSAFTRLFSGYLLPESMERILYLDCDTVIRGNIEPLASVNVDNKIFLGVKDCIGSTYKKNIGLKPDSVYINAGVLLINLNELRKFNMKSIIDRYMKKYVKLINYADQDILNGIFYDRVGELNPKYNVMTIDVVCTYKEIQILRNPTNFYTESELKSAVSNPTIIHYTTNMRVIRPWFTNADHPLKKEFLKYMAVSPWKSKDLSEMKFDSKEAKSIANRMLGIIHSKLKPLYIRFKALKSFSIKRI